jgi:hypothetical protein
MGAATEAPRASITDRCLSAQLHARQILEQAAETQARLRATMADVREGRARRAPLHDAAYARLATRLATLPLVEQAKGILVAQIGCSSQEAGDVLRIAARGSETKLRELAAKIIDDAVRNSRKPAPGAQGSSADVNPGQPERGAYRPDPARIGSSSRPSHFQANVAR